jgi:DNA-binding response OmpR family regulator
MILFVDDEASRTDSYIRELKLRGHEVDVMSDVDSALEVVLKDPSSVQLVILDVMMPPGKAFRNAKTLVGLRTGICFFEAIRRTQPALPIVVFTNVTEPSIRTRFQGERACWFMEKWRYLPADFAREVKQILDTSATVQQDGGQKC